MNIDIVTFSCNDSPMYYEFWNPISKFWKEKFGIHPVLFYCGDSDIDLSEQYGTVYRHKNIEGVPSYLSAIWGRFWITSKYQNKFCLTGDIDMIPMSADFFDPKIKTYSDDAYVHLNADAYRPGDFNFWRTGYYTLIAHDHLARGDIYQRVYQFEDTFEAEMKKFASVDYSDKGDGYGYHPEEHLRHASKDNGGKWLHEELYSTDMLRQYERNGGKVICELSLPRSRRLDRSYWSYHPQDVVDGKYIDSHLLRPYSQYKEHIDYVMSLVKGI